MFGSAYKWAALIVAKGAALSALMFALDVAFWKQLLVATVSSTVTGVIVLLLGRAVAAAIRALKTEIEHVKRGLGLDKRAEDADTTRLP